MGVLCDVKIVENSAGGNDSRWHGVDPEAFERACLELFEQTVHCGVFGKNPVVELEGKIVFREAVGQQFLVAALHEHFFRSEIAEKFFYIVSRTFGCEKFAGRNVEKGHPDGLLTEVESREEVVFAMVKQSVVDRYSGGDQFGDAALDKLLCGLRIFQLLAYGHPLAGPDEFRQIGVKSVVRKSGKLHILGRPVGPSRKGYAENF